MYVNVYCKFSNTVIQLYWTVLPMLANFQSSYIVNL